MKNLKIYEPSDKMITLIKDDCSVLQTLGSFGINLGFGDKTVSETCQMNEVDTYTFLAVVNFTINGHGNFADDERISVPTLLHYLKASHTYYLDFQLPFIRRELQERINEDDALGMLIMKLYEGYAQEIRRHILSAGTRSDGVFLLLWHFGPERAGNGLMLNRCWKAVR